MVNFRQLVESLLLCEGDLSTVSAKTVNDDDEFLKEYKPVFKNISVLDKRALGFIHDELKKNFIAGKNWKFVPHYFPLFFAIVEAYGGSLTNAKNGIGSGAGSPGIGATKSSVSKFYEDLHLLFKSLSGNSQVVDQIEKLLNHDISDYSNAGAVPPPAAKTVYRNAMSEASREILAQDVWPTINSMTITNAVSNLIQTRLSGMEKLQLKFAFFPPLNVLKKEGSFDKIIEKTVTNYNSFIRGQYTFSKDFQSVLQEIDITAKDFANLIHYVREVMKGLMSAKLRLDNPSTDPKTGFPDDKLLEKVNNSIKQNSFVLKFCKEGILDFYDKDDKIQTILDKTTSNPIIYNLEKIEELATEESNKLIEIIKEMSTGVRTKSQAWQKFKEERFHYLTQAASSIASFAGAKLYG